MKLPHIPQYSWKERIGIGFPSNKPKPASKASKPTIVKLPKIMKLPAGNFKPKQKDSVVTKEVWYRHIFNKDGSK